MTLRIVRLGEPRIAGEGKRIGAVGVRREGAQGPLCGRRLVRCLVPDLAPSPELMARGKAAATDNEWSAFVRAFRHEMDAPTARRALDLLAALSRDADFSVGCYCEEEERCHRSVLRGLLVERGASLG